MINIVRIIRGVAITRYGFYIALIHLTGFNYPRANDKESAKKEQLEMRDIVLNLGYKLLPKDNLAIIKFYFSSCHKCKANIVIEHKGLSTLYS